MFPTIQDLDGALLTLSHNKPLNCRIKQIFSNFVILRTICVRERLLNSLVYHCVVSWFVSNILKTLGLISATYEDLSWVISSVENVLEIYCVEVLQN